MKLNVATSAARGAGTAVVPRALVGPARRGLTRTHPHIHCVIVLRVLHRPLRDGPRVGRARWTPGFAEARKKTPPLLSYGVVGEGTQSPPSPPFCHAESSGRAGWEALMPDDAYGRCWYRASDEW